MNILNTLSDFADKARSLLGMPPKDPAQEQLSYGLWLIEKFQPQFDTQMQNLSRAIDRVAIDYGVFSEELAAYESKRLSVQTIHGAYTTATAELNKAVTDAEKALPAFRQHPTEIMTVKIEKFVGAMHAIQKAGTQQLRNLIYVHSPLSAMAKNFPEDDGLQLNFDMATASLYDAQRRPSRWSLNKHERRLSAELKALDLSSGP